MNALMEDNLPPHLVERRRADGQAPETLKAVKQFIVPNQASFQDREPPPPAPRGGGRCRVGGGPEGGENLKKPIILLFSSEDPRNR